MQRMKKKKKRKKTKKKDLFLSEQEWMNIGNFPNFHART